MEEPTRTLYEGEIRRLQAELAELREELTKGLGPLGPDQKPLTPVEAYRIGYKTGSEDLAELREQMQYDHDEDAWRLRYTELREAVRAYLKKYDELKPAMDGAFTVQAIHGMPYSGPTWEQEIDRLRQLIEEKP